MIRFTVLNEFYKSIEGEFPKEISGTDNIHLYAAKGTTAVFQLLFSSDEPFCLTTGSRAYFSQELQRPTVRIKPSCGTAKIEKYHTINDGRRVADAILDADTAEFESTAAVFCTVDVPPDATGSISCRVDIFMSHLFSPETAIGTVNAEITVYDFRMPEKLRFYLDLWQHHTAIARAHGVPLWSDEHFMLIDRYAETLGQLGQKCVSIVVSDVPWAGQGCFARLPERANLYEYSMVPIKRCGDRFIYDFAPMQRCIDIYARHGVDTEITLFGLIGIWQRPEHGFVPQAEDRPDSLHVRYLDEDGAFRYMDKGEDIDAYISALERYFRETGQLDKVRVCADEPSDADAFAASLARLHAAAPGFKLKCAICHSEFIGKFCEIQDYVPYLTCLATEYDTISRYRDKMKDHRFLWYVCCGPQYPNTFIKSPLLQTIFIAAFTAFAGLDGFLRWNYCVYNEDPLMDIRYMMFDAGDLNFVYPSPSGKPLLTIRWYALKRAAEIFELISVARERRADVQSLLESVIPVTDINKYADGSVSEECVTSKSLENLYKELLDLVVER